jgi:tetratricopeptide (TPR) repeat protein
VLYAQPVQAQSARKLVEEGIALDKQGRFADALTKFEQAQGKAPELTRILLLVAGEHLKLGNPEQALALFETFQQQQPSPDAEEQELLRDGYRSISVSLEQAVSRSPQRPELLLLAGRAAFRSQRLEQARELFLRYLKAVPEANEATRTVRERYLREFHVAVTQQLPARIGQQPAAVALWRMLAESQLALGQDEAALDSLDRYREGTSSRTPEESAALSQRYQTLVQHWGTASGAATLLRGRAHFGLGKLDAAADDYARYRQGPGDPSYADRQSRYERELQEVLAQQQAAVAQREAEAQARLAQERAAAAQRAAEERRRAAEQRARASRWMLWTGAAGMVAGAGLLALGITAIAYDGRCINDAMPCDQRYDSLNLGIGTTVAGGALIVGGGSLLGIGLVRSKRAP